MTLEAHLLGQPLCHARHVCLDCMMMRSRHSSIQGMIHMQGLSIACSTPEAIAWDPSWAGSHEISGRAMRNVHDSAEGFAHNTARAAPPPAAAQLPSSDALEATILDAASAVSPAAAAPAPATANGSAAGQVGACC